VNKYSFTEEPNNNKPIWHYFSETGYLPGNILYPTSTGDILTLLNYLKVTNYQLHQNKSFKIVPVDLDNLKMDGKILHEVLTV
jgi:hypothetical protein